jgi:hypothetical protein
LSIDPVTTDANTGGSFNRYAYAANSPYKYIDPDGRQEAAAERFGNQFSKDVAAGNSSVIEPLIYPAVAVGAVPVAVTVVAGAMVGGPIAAAAGAAVVKTLAPRTDFIGKNIVQWGTKQSPEAVAQTVARTEQMTPKVVEAMKQQGLTKAWVEKQAAQYGSKLEAGGSALKNTQLQPRSDLLQKILEHWQDPTHLQ